MFSYSIHHLSRQIFIMNTKSSLKWRFTRFPSLLLGLELIQMKRLECSAFSIEHDDFVSVNFSESRMLRQRLECQQFILEGMQEIGVREHGKWDWERSRHREGMSRVHEGPIPTETSENIDYFPYSSICVRGCPEHLSTVIVPIL